jgi:hypothetical protein
MDFSRSYILNIFIGVICIFALIIFIDISNINLNPDKSTKKLVQVVNIEALKNKKNSTEEDTTEEDTPLPAPEPNKSNISINMSPVDDFCKSNSDSLKESCGKLTKKNPEIIYHFLQSDLDADFKSKFFTLVENEFLFRIIFLVDIN